MHPNSFLTILLKLKNILGALIDVAILCSTFLAQKRAEALHLLKQFGTSFSNDSKVALLPGDLLHLL